MIDRSSSSLVTRMRDGRAWRIGTDAEVAWIANGTSPGLEISSAIPLVFEAYATIVVPAWGQADARRDHDRLVVRLLAENASEQPWWLGYLDTGSVSTAGLEARRVHPTEDATPPGHVAR